ncbi:hypothetical protein ACGFIF_12715 [Kribbella sp. NPDC049174]|uniref:hypothetical protein n=1 Tax=Kribbella sp. NPDC049174 TaxID=3364112 RepID=UPI00371EEFAF
MITGDRVVLKDGDIKRVTVTPGKGREGVTFRISRTNGRLSVIPLDVSSEVTSGRLDRRLFDVSGLLEMKYDQGATRLYRDGKLLAADDSWAGQLFVENAPAAKALYRLEVSLQRSLMQLATRVDHVWTFSLQDTGGAKEVLPLRSVEFRPVVDAHRRPR